MLVVLLIATALKPILNRVCKLFRNQSFEVLCIRTGTEPDLHVYCIWSVILGYHEPYYPWPGASVKTAGICNSSPCTWCFRQAELSDAICFQTVSDRLLLLPACRFRLLFSWSPSCLTLGVGVSAPLPSLGSMATDALSGMYTYTYRLIVPSVILSIMILAFNLFGDGLRDALDPKLKK